MALIFLIVAALLELATSQVPMIGILDDLVSVGDSIDTVTCIAAFATKDQIHWIKLNDEDVTEFQMSTSPDCMVPTTPSPPTVSGSGSLSGRFSDIGSGGSSSQSFSGSGQSSAMNSGMGSGATDPPIDPPMLPPYLARGTVFANGSNLTAPNVTFGNEGYYVCVITLPSSICYSRNLTLTVAPGALDVNFTPSNTSNFGDNVTCTCSALGGPDNVFQWQKDGMDLSGDNQSTLELNSVDASDGGVYTCVVSNPAGNDSATVTLNVGPVIETPPMSANATLTETAALTCTVNGFPVPNITWLHNGTEYEEDGSRTTISDMVRDRSVTSTLTINMAMVNDSGQYICNATSSSYDVVSSDPATLLVRQTPERPQNVTVVEVTTTSVVLEWVESHDNNAPILGYRVSYITPLFLGGSEMTVNSSVEMVNITGLHPGGSYNLSVIAFNSIGDGAASDPLIVTTVEAAPTSPPENVSADVVSSTEIRVCWEQVMEVNRHGEITEYEVMYDPLMTFDGMLYVMTRNTSNLSIILTDLEEYVEYSISVRAYTSVGPGPYSMGIISRTEEDIPSAAPVNLIAVSSGPNSLNVSWEPPPEIDINGILTNYTIEYFIADQPDDPRDIPGSTPFTVLEGLNNFTIYNVFVSANTVAGRGPSINMTEHTDENVPGESPRSIFVEIESSTSIRVDWAPPRPEVLFGILRSYRVRYRVSEQSNSTVIIVTAVKNRTLIIDGLLEFTNYSVEVTAVTVGEGPYSDPVMVTTDQDIPDDVPRPPEVPESSITAFSVAISWDPPADPNGEIIQYTVNIAITDNTTSSRRRRQARMFDPVCVIGGMDNINRIITVRGNPPATSLTLNDLTPFSTYEFVVQAETIVGAGNFSPPRSFLTPEDVPSEPWNLAVRPLSSTAIEVTWDQPQCDYGVRTGYNISHEAILGTGGLPLGDVGSLSSLIQNNPLSTNLTVSGLSPYTNYTFTLCALTSVGCGPVSADTTQTDEDAPDAVTNLQVVSSCRNGTNNRVIIEILWDRPSVRNGPFNYMLFYSAHQTSPFPSEKMDSASADNISINGDDDSYTVVEMDSLAYAEFTVDIFAFNIRRGDGIRSTTVTATSRTIAIEPTEVLDLNAITTSFQSFIVRWMPPQFPNSEITSYIVYYGKSSSTQDAINRTIETGSSCTYIGPHISNDGYTRVNTTMRTFEIFNLDPYTNYTVHVRAIGNLNLQGSVIEEVRIRTNITNPSAVQSLKAEALSSSVLRITWDPPAFPNGPLSHYNLYYRQADTPQSGTISSAGYTVEETSSTTLDIRSLPPFTNYTIHVQAFITELPYVLGGEIDTEIVHRTNSDVPDDPPTAADDTTPEVSHEFIPIVIPDPLDIRTGRVILVAVVVVKDPPSTIQESSYLDAAPFSGRPSQTYYITAAWDESAIQAQQVPSLFTVGSQTSPTTVNGILYRNGQLNANTGYALFVRYDIEADDSLEPLRAYSDIVVTRTSATSVLIQLRLSGIDRCQTWVVDDAKGKLETINVSLASNVERRCQCGFSVSNIVEPRFRCFADSEDAVTYRAEIRGFSNDIRLYIEQWLMDGAVVAFEFVFVPVDSSCQVVISSVLDPECNIPTPMTIPTVVGSIIGAVLLVVGIVLVILVMYWVYKRRTGTLNVTKARGEVGMVHSTVRSQEAEYEELDTFRLEPLHPKSADDAYDDVQYQPALPSSPPPSISHAHSPTSECPEYDTVQVSVSQHAGCSNADIDCTENAAYAVRTVQ